MGPYSSTQTTFEFWNLRIEILVILASKGHLWKNGSLLDFSPERAYVMVLCLMSPIGKIHLLPNSVQC